MSPCALSATAGALGSTSPVQNSTSHNGTATANIPPNPAIATTSRTTVHAVAQTLATTSTWCGSNQRISRALTWVAAISHTALAPNIRPNCCWDSPYCNWNTNEPPATNANSPAMASPATSTRPMNDRSVNSPP